MGSAPASTTLKRRLPPCVLHADDIRKIHEIMAEYGPVTWSAERGSKTVESKDIDAFLEAAKELEFSSAFTASTSSYGAPTSIRLSSSFLIEGSLTITSTTLTWLELDALATKMIDVTRLRQHPVRSALVPFQDVRVQYGGTVLSYGIGAVVGYILGDTILGMLVVGSVGAAVFMALSGAKFLPRVRLQFVQSPDGLSMKAEFGGLVRNLIYAAVFALLMLVVGYIIGAR